MRPWGRQKFLGKEIKSAIHYLNIHEISNNGALLSEKEKNLVIYTSVSFNLKYSRDVWKSH